MKNIRGVSMLELMVGIVLGAGVIALITSSYGSIYSLFLYNTNLLSLNQELRLSLSVIERDIQNAGVFGSYSFHNQGASTYTYSAAAIPGCSNTNWCQFDSTTVGVKSFNSDTDSILPSGAVLAPNSEILRIQYGGTKVAYLDPKDFSASCTTTNGNNCMICNNGSNYWLNNTYWVDQGVESSSKLWMLVSSNHAYLLNFANSQTVISSDPTVANRLWLTFPSYSSCSNSLPQIQIESYLHTNTPPKYKYVSYDPDMYSMQLTNFYTRYYFTLKNSGGYESGLYVRTLQSSGTLSAANMISATVKSISFTYKVDSTAAQLNKIDNAGANRYAQCTTSMLQNLSGNVQCSNGWSKITAINITESGMSAKLVSSNLTYLSESMTDSIGWQS